MRIILGGDDLKMKGWDIRQGFSRPLFVNKWFVLGYFTTCFIVSNPLFQFRRRNNHNTEPPTHRTRHSSRQVSLLFTPSARSTVS